MKLASPSPIHPLAVTALATVFLLSAAVGCGKKKENPAIDDNPVVFQKEGELELVTREDSVRHRFDIEIADSEYEIQTGLMYRQQMQDRQGMLFIFEQEDYRSFYMKNTEIPLDILFVSGDSIIVTIHKNARPLDETSLPSDKPAQFVFEINGGLSDRLGIQVGDRIAFRRL